MKAFGDSLIGPSAHSGGRHRTAHFGARLPLSFAGCLNDTFRPALLALGHFTLCLFTLGLFTLCLFASCLFAWAPVAGAQTYKDAEQAPGGVISLPHELTPEERLILDEIGLRHRETPPPTAQPVRHVAEFEPMQGVLITYPLGISTSIVREMAEETIVYCIVTSSQQNNAEQAFIGAGVNMDHVVFFNQATDSYWTRDYGPWYIFDDDLAPGIVDVIYNRPRPNDDEIPTEFAAFLGIDAYGPNLIHTGGNWMVDGHGIAASSELVWEENPGLTPDEIDQIVSDYLGIHTYHVVPDPNNTYIDHIDCWSKFLAVDKVLIREVPPTHPQYEEIEETADYFAAQISSYGWPFEVVRVYTPNDEPYTNSLILNKKVLVPVNGSSWDDEALATYEAAMPGYEVLGFSGSWQSTDALHCRTKGVADLDMLYVWSRPLRNTANTNEPYRVAAEIVDHSEAGLVPDQLQVRWRVGDSGPFNAEVMAAVAGTDSFYADIPPQSLGSTVQYYVHAEDLSGRAQDFPIVGPDGPFVFTIEEDLIPPAITGTTDLRSTEDPMGPYAVTTTVTDNMTLDTVELRFRVNGGVFSAVTMTPGDRGAFAAGIPGQPHGSFVEYYVLAADGAGNQATDPPDAPSTCFSFYVAPVTIYLTTDLESGSTWTHGPISSGYGDQWHLSSQRNHTPGGQTSWKCGDTGGGDYADLLDAGLVTETCQLGTDSQLRIWHWIEAETSSYYAGYAYDGGLVEIDTGAGWEVITPVDGYPYLIRNTGGSGPFPAETGVFSGSAGWTEAVFDLTSYEGEARFRFRFGSDNNTAGEGWYVDDLTVDGFEITGAEVIPSVAAKARFELLAANPIAATGRIALRLFSEEEVSLQVFSPDGRLVEKLIDGRLVPGAYELQWPGMRAADRTAGTVGTGVFFYRLQVGEEVRQYRVVRIR